MKYIVKKLNDYLTNKLNQNGKHSFNDSGELIKQHKWFSGNYTSWEQAMRDCTGYDAPNILEKVKQSLLKVKNGEALYERDSVLFDHVEYSMPLLIFLLYVSSASGNKLNILDFGGSLGSSYFQNRKYLDKVSDLKWSIVEQLHFVECGNVFFQDGFLKFYKTISECKKDRNPNVILLSSVLPYLPDPYLILRKILNIDFEFVILDRTPFFTSSDLPDRLTIEHVPPEIYTAIYPAWFFNEKKFLQFFESKYIVKEKLQGNDTQNLNDTDIVFKAILFEHR